MKKNPWLSQRNIFSSSVPKAIEKPKLKLKFGKIIWLAIKKTCMLIGAVVLFSTVLTMCALSPFLQEQQQALPNDMVLFMKLDGKLGDLPVEEGVVDAFSDNPKTLRTFINAIYAAKDDPRVKGIYAQYAGGGYALSQIQELRTAIQDFKTSGKFTYIYAPSYNSGLGAYYLISAFDEVWLQPMGTLAIMGVNAEIPFFKDTLDMVGVEPQFFQRKEYKSAYESLTNSEISPANKESMTQLIDDITDVIAADLSVDLGVSADVFKSYVDRGLFLADEAKDKGLIDVLGYKDELENKIILDVGNLAEYVKFDRYVHYVENHKGKRGHASKSNVALVYVVGAIVGSGEVSRAPAGLMNDGYAHAEKIAEALMDAAKDSSIAAVVLRVDSPGGSPVASETILHAVEKVREAGKPVIVSMGSAAASGGYWVSAYADYIIASPLTLTGSIGVLGGKVSLGGLWDKLGVNWARIQWGENSGMWSMNTPFSESEAERMNAMLDNIYDSFIARVAKGRDMSPEHVEKIARGHVWSGKSAIEIGLVDQFGGLNEALDYAAMQIGAAGRNDINVQVMPKPLSAVEKIIELLEGQVRAGEVIGLQADFISQLRPVLSHLNVVKQSSMGSVYEPLSVQ
ncbi:MAG: signal peptide peptidase SppA [Alphaproteobacteria bacterium]